MVGYQGGKRRCADVIADVILSHRPQHVYDLGAGSGAVTLALVRRGFHPSKITAVDAGPWGDVWAAIGEGTFDVVRLEALLREAHARPPEEVKAWVEGTLASMPYTPESFLVLQAASHGATPVWHDGMGWRRGDGLRRYCARGYWQPGPGSKETKPRGTIFAADKIVTTARNIAVALRGIQGHRALVESIALKDGAFLYCDPPYEGTSGYGYAMDWRSLLARHRPLLLSEGRPMEDATRTMDLDARKGAALHGGSLGRGSEYLSLYL